MKEIKNAAYAPSGSNSSRYNDEDEDDDDYGYDDDDDDEDEDDDNGKGISTKLEKAMTIGGLIVGAIIICILVYFIVFASGGLKFNNKDKDNDKKVENTGGTDKESTEKVEVPDLTGSTPDEARTALNLSLIHIYPDYTAVPMSVCAAMSQGYIGYDVQNAIRAELLRRGIYKPVSTVLTQVTVDPVSYTHLDVYKRQVYRHHQQNCPGTSDPGR